MSDVMDRLADSYGLLLDGLDGFSLSDRICEAGVGFESEYSIQLRLQDGEFGSEFVDQEGKHIVILNLGRWNRAAGPDFINAEIEVDGVRLRGDIELDRHFEDWERHGHGSNPCFNNVVLHLACIPPKNAWYTRNQRHEQVRCALIATEGSLAVHGDNRNIDFSAHGSSCGRIFDDLADDEVDRFLQAVAAYRLRKKRKFRQGKVGFWGEDQVLYESLAETLGYSSNKWNMRNLAKRAKLADIRHNPEPLLYGIAGYLVPVLKENCDEETRKYHKELWDFWWKNREDLELTHGREIQWVLSNIRPANHPQRRLAALAVIVSKWEEWKSLCRLSKYKELVEWMTSITHPYWSKHVTLPSPTLDKPLALIGKERAMDFIVNNVACLDESDNIWNLYLTLPGGSLNRKVSETAEHLLKDAGRIKRLTRKAYQQQALMQICDDFCVKGCSDSCLLPSQAPAWIRQV